MRLGIAAGIAVVALMCVGASAATAQGSPAQLCTWGGTPASPTGELTIGRPGTTNLPAAKRLTFRASGPLAGGGRCTGTMTFVGYLDAGSNCLTQVFEGRVLGVPGVARFWGPGAFGLVHEFLYDRAGAAVGSDQPQILSNAEQNPLFFTACGAPPGQTPPGFRHGNFSATVELYGTRP